MRWKIYKLNEQKIFVKIRPKISRLNNLAMFYLKKIITHFVRKMINLLSSNDSSWFIEIK